MATAETQSDVIGLIAHAMCGMATFKAQKGKNKKLFFYLEYF